MNYRALLLKVLLGVLILCLIASVFANMTFGFLHLLLVFVILIIVPLSYSPRITPEDNDENVDNTPIPPHYARMGSVFLIVLLLCCYIALDNYINPSSQVFNNNDHHAVRVDGLEINHPDGFVLAADNNRAFLDTVGFPGEATIADVGGGMVQLRLRGVTRPLYRYYYSENLRNYKQEIINYEQSFVVGPSDPSFTLINYANHRLKVTIEEHEYRKHWYSIYKSDSTTYWFQLDEEEPRKATYSTYLHTGLEMDHILPEIEGFDLRGLSLVRPTVRPTAKRNEVFKDLGGQYTFDINTEALRNRSIRAIECNGQTFELSALADREISVNIPFGQTIVFGYGEVHTEPLSFAEGKDGKTGIQLKYNCPFYRTLSKISDETRNTLYITSTLGKGNDVVDPDLPENVLLFDFFHRRSNRHNMVPSYLTFISGPTNEPLKMQLAVGNTITKDLQAGTPFQHIGVRALSQEDIFGENWMVSVQNFRATTPFSQLKICLYLLLLTTLSIIVLNVRNRDDKFPVTYSHVELAAYMLILCLMTIRLFLMWRLSVFPPVSSITNFELHNFFWQGNLWKWFYGFTIASFAVIFYFKQCVLKYQTYNWFQTFNILIIRDNVLGRVIENPDNSSSENDMDPWMLAKEQREILQNTINNFKVPQNNDQLKTFKEFGKELINDKFIGIFFLLSILVGALCFVGRSFRLCTIFIPVIFYFFGDMLLTARYGRTYKEDLDDQKEGHTASYVRALHVKPFILTSFNMLFWSIMMFLNDGGFGILFLSFGLIWTQLKLREIDLYIEGKGGRWINLLLILMVGLLVFYKDLFLLAISNPCFFILSCGLIAFVIVLLVCRILVGQFKKGIIWGISACSALVVIIGALLLVNFVIPGNHIEQRIRVHMSSPAEQLMTIGDAQTERRFLEASLNDWILSEYYNDGKDIKLLGDWGHSYFQLKPHSKLGAMWGAQASDISLSRYVIAEHGHLLPITLICAFLLLLCIGISRSSHSRVAKGLLIQIPLLLFVQSLLIWMTVTRRFIFLGQDFPLISCNSKVTILYTLSLLAIWICAMIHESLVVNKRSVRDDNNIIRSSTQNMWYFLFLMFIVGIAFSAKQVISHYQSGVYELSNALENLSQTLNNPIVDVSELQVEDNRHDNQLAISNAPTGENNLEEEEQDETVGILYSINDLIDMWQAAIIDRNDTAYYRHHITDIGNTHAVMKAFDATYGKYIENALDKEESMSLAKRLYRYYINELSRRNSYDGILHMHRNRSTGRATLAVRTDYYHASHPSRPRYSWTGNVIGSKRHSASVNRINNINYNLTRFPGSWFKDGQDVVILKRKNGIISVRTKGAEAPLNVDDYILSQSVRLFPQDKVCMGTRNVDLSTILPEHPVWARNLQVNGQRRFVYPLQDKDFWIRNFANEMKLIAEKRLSDKEESQLGDIPITLDQELELNIYHTIARSSLKGEERAVVVVNGEGHVCAMVDFKIPNYRLDPNDEKRILDMDKKLYMIGGHGSDEERRCLGSSALLPLRYGMGSTQKPLVYAAVTAGFDLGCPGSPFSGWGALNLDTIRQSCVDVQNGDVFQRYYTGISFYKKTPFRSPLGDEGGLGMVNPLYYLRKSSNYYNSVLVYMGSYPADFYSPTSVASFLQIATTQDETTMLRRVKEPRFMSRQEYEEAWPIMRIGGSPLAFNMSPVSVDQTKSLLQQQFEKLFDLSTSFNRKDRTSLYSSISDSIRISYVYPEPSFLDAKMRTQKGKEFVENTIRKTATGQRTVWNVSPLMMAQMYARLLPGQARIRLNIDPNCPHPPYANLQSNANDEVMNTIYRGMHEVFTGGTAHHVHSNLVKNGYLSDNPATTSPNRFPNKHYWIYGKTGTIGKIKDKKGRTLRDNDRLLAVVITDHDLTDPELDPNNLHYYVIFMTFYNTPSTYSGLQAEIIKQVMDSEVFKEYM